MAQNGHSTRIVAILLGTRHGVSVSRMTVNRALKMGRKPLQYLPVIRGRRLSDVNQLKRVAFCQQSTRQQWHKIIFADSKFLYVYEDKARGWLFKWQNPDSREVVPQHSNPFVFHFYAAVGTGFKSSLVFVPPTRGDGVKDTKKKPHLRVSTSWWQWSSCIMKFSRGSVGGQSTAWYLIMQGSTPARHQKQA